MRVLGIDFSGSAAQWSPRCGRPTVWIATVEGVSDLRLVDLRPVQRLAGDGAAFDRLVSLLRSGDFDAAGIDAPFSIPERFLPPGGHAALLEAVAALPIEPGRPFPRGADLLTLAHRRAEPLEKKPYRRTEREAGRGVNTRSTLWNGPRGGAAFTVACLLLLRRAKRPIWPWHSGAGMLVEAFPAAQLRRWNLPASGYGKPEQRFTRSAILDALAMRLRFDDAQRTLMQDCPDALDAVLASFGAAWAVRNGPVADPPADGLIAVG